MTILLIIMTIPSHRTPTSVLWSQSESPRLTSLRHSRYWSVPVELVEHNSLGINMGPVPD